MNTKKVSYVLAQAAGILLRMVFIVIFLYPVYIIFVSALKSKMELAFNPSGLPVEVTLDNFIQAFKTMNYLRSMANTIIVVGVVVIFNLLTSAMAAYAIARKGKSYNWIYFVFLAGLMMPFQMRMIPLYKMLVNMGMINSLTGVILVYCGSMASMSVFLLSGFVKAIPRELDEAARIDGAGQYQIFFTIVLPLLKSALVTVGILCAFNIWNDYLMPMLFLAKKDKLTITVTLSFFQGRYGNNWSMIFAGVCMIVVPMLIIYMTVQNAIIDGITAGAVKG